MQKLREQARKTAASQVAIRLNLFEPDIIRRIESLSKLCPNLCIAEYSEVLDEYFPGEFLRTS